MCLRARVCARSLTLCTLCKLCAPLHLGGHKLTSSFVSIQKFCTLKAWKLTNKEKNLECICFRFEQGINEEDLRVLQTCLSFGKSPLFTVSLRLAGESSRHTDAYVGSFEFSISLMHKSLDCREELRYMESQLYSPH